jgi:uncharacterized membrane protein
MNTTYPMTTVRAPSSNDRLAAAIAHGGTWVSWFVAPLLVYVLKRGESRYVEFHALPALLGSAFGTLVSALTCGLAIPVFMGFHLWAGWKVLNNEEYEYPIVGDFARGWLSASSS